MVKLFAVTADTVLTKFHAAFDKLYGDRIEHVVIYGSRARGDVCPDSDYDVAVFLKDLSDRWAEADRIAIATTDILAECRLYPEFLMR